MQPWSRCACCNVAVELVSITEPPALISDSGYRSLLDRQYIEANQPGL
jgi:hypothetical protein